MSSGRLGDSIGMREEVIKKACSLAMKAHKSSSPEDPFLLERSRSSPEIFIAFPGSWAVNDWYSKKPFGETKVDLSWFPSLRSIGTDEVAVVNEAFLGRFQAILQKTDLQREVEKAVVTKRKQIVFTGHSSGGPLAILAALWFLDNYIRPNSTLTAPQCVTFGSPLAGDKILSHALRRENWARYFIHLVMRYDIVPRIMLSPLSPIQQALEYIILFFNPKSPFYKDEQIATDSGTSDFFTTVVRSASCVASRIACNLKGCTNLLLQTLTSFVEISPYRPFGTYIFCTGNGRLVVVNNPDGVLQLLFYCLQLSSEGECAHVALRSLKEHLLYETELQESLEMQNVVYLDSLEQVPLSSDGSTSASVATTNAALNDLGLSTRARLCLRAAGEFEQQKLKNQQQIDFNRNEIEKVLKSMEEYRASCEVRSRGYYDAFKIQNDEIDFQANVKRLNLAGMWDEIIEMLKRYELPDGFEGRKEWIELGTRYRRLVEPLDIANYYRHSKNEDTGPYLTKGRPKRYRFTQRWREHAESMSNPSSESCFWAEVEELKTSDESFDVLKERILLLEGQLYQWIQAKQLGKDIFMDGSTLVKWWRTLPYQHQQDSCLKQFISS